MLCRRDPLSSQRPQAYMLPPMPFASADSALQEPFARRALVQVVVLLVFPVLRDHPEVPGPAPELPLQASGLKEKPPAPRPIHAQRQEKAHADPPDGRQIGNRAVK